METKTLAPEELRRDGRRRDQLRALECEQGLLHRADGSARVNQGETSVIVAVYGPITVSPKRVADAPCGFLTAHFISVVRPRSA